MLERSVALWQRVAATPALLQDGALYLCSGVFGLLTATFAVSSDYRAWGTIAGSVYLAAACCCAFVYRRRPHRPEVRLRRVLVGLVGLGAVVAPLGAELVWRAEALPGAHAQPEVAVIERAADRVMSGHSPYLARPHNVGVAPSSDAHGVDSASYFPYLPGMVVFGVLNATGLPRPVGDARVLIVLSTFAICALALDLSGAPASRRGRVVQFLVALPWGALPLVTGGDDLPVLALVLLGLVLLARRRPFLAGAVLGAASTLKVTAWPILLLGLLVARRPDERRAPVLYAAAAAALLVPVVALGFASSPAGFLENVVRFPLGLGVVRSPAASPLLGQALTTLLPADRRVVTAVLFAVGVVLVLGVLWRRPPKSAADVAGFTAFALLVATVLAPATRFGYLIYPANLLAFSYLLAAVEQRRPQLWSSTSKSRSSTLLDVVESAPASAGVIEGLAGSTTTPTSQ